MSVHQSVSASAKSNLQEKVSRIHNTVFAFSSTLISTFNKHNFVAGTLILLEILQFLSLVINRHFRFIHPALDPRHFLHFLLFSGYDTAYWAPVSHQLITFAIPTLAIVLASLTGLGTFLSSKSQSNYLIVLSSRVLLDLTASIFFLPLTITTFSWLNCSDSSPFVSVPLDSCWTLNTTFYKFGLLFSWSILFVLSLFRASSLVDINPLSKKFFACFNRSFLIDLIFVKVVFAFLLTLFDHLPWIFNIFYPLICAYLLISFIYRIPFYRSFTNKFIAFFLGILTCVSIIWFILLFIPSSFPQWITTLILFSTPLFFGFISVKSVEIHEKFWRSRAGVTGKFASKILKHVYNYQDSEFAEEFNEDGDPELLQISSICKYPYQVEKLCRSLLGSPNSSVKIKDILNQSNSKFQSDISMSLIKTVYELFICRDPISTLASCNTINAKDLQFELNFAHKFLLFECSRLAHSMRRELSTGTNLDSSAFVSLQRSLKAASDLHKEVLEFLALFWSSLVSDHGPPQLNLLSPITEKIYETKKEGENSFNTLLQNHPNNSEVLRSYSKFASEILMDEDLANHLMTQCDLAGSSRHSSEDHSSFTGSHASENVGSKRRKRRRRTGMIFTQSSTNQRQDATSSTDLLRISVHFSLILLTFSCVFSFFFLSQSMTKFSNFFEYAYEIGHFGSSLMDVSYHTFLLKSLINGQDFSFDLSNIRDSIRHHSAHSLFHLRRLLLGSDSSFTSSSAFDCPSSTSELVPFSSSSLVSMLRDPIISVSSSSVPVSIWELSVDFLRQASGLSVAENFTEESAEFIINGRNSQSQSITLLLQVLRKEVENSVTFSLILDSVLVFLTITLIIYIGVVLFSRSLKQITVSKIEIFNLFLFITPNIVREILSDAKFSDCQSAKNLLSNHNISNFDDEFSNDQEVIEDESGLLEEKKVEIIKNNSKGKIILFTFLLSLVLLSIFYVVFMVYSLNSELSTVSNLSKQSISTWKELKSINSRAIKMSDNLLLFVNTGDLRYYLRYFRLLTATDYQNSLQSIRSTNLTLDERYLIGVNVYLQSIIEYRDLIVLKLAKKVYNFNSNQIPVVENFSYNIENEPNYQLLPLQFPSVQKWYSNFEHDVTYLTDDELIDLCRSILSNRRFLTDNMKRLQSIESLITSSQSFVSSSQQSIKNSLEIFSASIPIFVFSLVIFLVFLYCSSFLFVKFFKGKRPITVFLFISIGLLLICSSLLIIFSAKSLKFSNSLTEFSNILSEFSLFSNHEQVASSLSLQFSQFADYQLYSSALASRKAAEKFVEILDNSYTFNTLFSLNFNISHEIFEKLEISRRIQDISFTLIGSSKNIDTSLIDQSMTWNLIDEPFYIKILGDYPNFDFGNFYSENLIDLALPLPEQFILGRNILTNQFYRNLLSSNQNLIDSKFDELAQNSQTFIDSEFSIIQNTYIFIIITSILSILSLIFLIIFSVSGLFCEKKKKAHVQQNLTFSAMNKIKRRYSLSLFLLSCLIIIMFFYTATSSSAVNHRISTLTLAGERLSLTSKLQTSALLLTQNHSILESCLVFQDIELLIGKHFEVLFGSKEVKGSIGQNLEQDKLNFVVNFELGQEISNSGLHILLEAVLNLATKIASSSIILDSESTEVKQLVKFSEYLQQYLLRSLTIYRDSALDFMENSRKVILIGFILILFSLLIMYVFVFRRMIGRLCEEQETVFLVLSMLPSTVIEQVPEIKEYFDNQSF
ncbi:hypothetical protein RCL1_000359 [Eukaryota sp. TZLM3-RCL]